MNSLNETQLSAIEDVYFRINDRVNIGLLDRDARTVLLDSISLLGIAVASGAFTAEELARQEQMIIDACWYATK